MTLLAGKTGTQTAAMTAGRRADTARRRHRVLKALDDATADGQEVSVSAIARRAGVDRSTPVKRSHPLSRAADPPSPGLHCKPT